MIRFNFNSLQAKRPIAVGPAPYFRVDGGSLREGPNDRIVAVFRQHHWQVDGHHLSSYECHDQTRVHFENDDGLASPVYGPFVRLHFPNGSLYADDRRIAEYREDSDRWRRCEDASEWSSIVIAPAHVV